MPQIIAVDNYDREIPGISDDRLILFIRDTQRAEQICALINEEDHGELYYKVVENGYVLRKFEY